MAKRRTKEQKVAAARIQNAVYGFSIPMLSIPALYRQMEEAISLGATDEDLKTVVAAFPGVNKQAI